MKRCNPEGWNCIERNTMNTFDCDVTCEGIYADVQWVNETEGERRDAFKYLQLISEYNNFKKRVIKHFEFDPSKTAKVFRK